MMKKDCELIVFKMLDLDGDNKINVVDLMQLCANFQPKEVVKKGYSRDDPKQRQMVPNSKGCPLGDDIHRLMRKYKDENLKSGYGRTYF
jgi:hypothetical protein